MFEIEYKWEEKRNQADFVLNIKFCKAKVDGCMFVSEMTLMVSKIALNKRFNTNY